MMDIDSRLAHAFVLLGRQFHVTEYVVRRRKPRVLSAFERAVSRSAQDLQDVLRVYELTFALVDNLVRYEKIASMLPRFNQKSEEYRLFSSRLAGMKELRNLLQHIQGDLDTEFESPILGGVTWAKGNVNYLAAFNDVGAQRSLPGLVYDTHKRRFAKDFCYVHNGTYYDFSSAINGYREYQRFVEQKCKVEIDGKRYNIKEHVIALRMAFSFPGAAAQQSVPGDVHPAARADRT